MLKRIAIPAVSSIALAACTQGLAQNAPAGSAAAAPAADLIITNARIYTVDAKEPWAQAVAIRDGKFVEVGSADEVAPLRDGHTRVVDAGGKLILPAFGDAHAHPLFGALGRTRCSLHDGKTIADYQATIAKCIEATPGDGTIYGVGWEDSLFPPNGVPRKELLDAVSTTRPLIFESVGGHTYWVNSLALKLGNITRDTPDPVNGKINRDPTTGEPVGGLQETAMGLVANLIPAPTPHDIQEAVIYTAHLFNSLGIVSWNDAGVTFDDDGDVPMADAYKAVEDAGKLTAHVSISLMWRGEQGVEQLPALYKAAARANAMGVPAHAVKFYVDGVLPQHTAYMLAPYEGTTTRGAPHIDPEVLKAATVDIDAHGMQGFYHAIGDGATHISLDAIEAARKANGPQPSHHHQITHLNVVDPADQARFGPLGVFAQVQPTWSAWYPYMELIEGVVGPKRMAYVHPGKGFIDGGGKLAYGADWPVATANPLEGLEVAITRRTQGDPNARPLNPEQGITLEQAIESHTLNAAIVNGFENVTGSITVGKSADLVILDSNIFEVPVYQISKAKVLVTLFEGNAVYGELAP